MKIMFAMLILAAAYLFVWFSIYNYLTRKRLKKHQEEWNIIRKRLENKGATRNEIEKEYVMYIYFLEENCKDKIGACFPAINNKGGE